MSLASGTTLPIGVIVLREEIDNAWQPVVWQPVSVFLHAAPVESWRELRRDARRVHYHAATLPLELHRKETASYIANLGSGRPSVYVVARDQPEDGERPIRIHLATASPFEVQAYGATEGERVHELDMPSALVELVAAFVGSHHVEETFLKRQRSPHDKGQEHLFGQEPLVTLRERMRRRSANEGQNG